MVVTFSDRAATAYVKIPGIRIINLFTVVINSIAKEVVTSFSSLIYSNKARSPQIVKYHKGLLSLRLQP